MLDTTASAAPLLLAKFTTTAAPSAARCSATEAPIPLEAPVTTATLLASLFMMILFSPGTGGRRRVLFRIEAGRRGKDSGEGPRERVGFRYCSFWRAGFRFGARDRFKGE